MPTVVAFIRAIFHMKMERLRRPVEAAGYENVDTYLASGNIIFNVETDDSLEVERSIEEALGKELDKEMDVFVRPMNRLAEIAAFRPFDDYEEHRVYIAFLKEAPGGEAREKIRTYTSEIDEFHVEGREVYWLCRTPQRESNFSGSVLERILGMPATLRNDRTVRGIVKKYG